MATRGMVPAGRGRALAVASVVLAMTSFQTGASLAKGLFPAFGALGTVGLRVGLAALILCAIWRPWRTLPPAGSALPVLVYGATLAAMNACFYQALVRLPLGVTVAIEFLGPLGVALLRSRRPSDLGCVLLVGAGMLLLLHGRAGGVRYDPVGVGFALLAAAGWAAYILAGVRLGRTMRAGPATALGMLVAALLIVPPALVLHRPAGGGGRALLPTALAVAVLSSALPYTLELTAMRRVSARLFGIMMSLEPAVAAMSGLLLLGEQLGPARWLGILLVVAASVGSVVAGDRSGPPL